MNPSRLVAVVVASCIGPVLAASVPNTVPAQARRMFVSVTDSKGAPVAGLTASDFVVRVAGKDATVVTVAPATEPLSVVVIPSGFRQSSISDARAALRAVIAAVRNVNPESRVGLMVGDGGTPPSMRAVSERADMLDREVSRFFESPNTALLDSILVASQTLGADPGRRRVILVLSLGSGGDGGLTPLRIGRAVRDADASLWVVEVGGFDRDLGSPEGRVFSEITKASGGRREASSIPTLPSALENIVSVIGAQYALTYEPPMAGEVSMVGVRKSGLSVFAPVWAGTNLANR